MLNNCQINNFQITKQIGSGAYGVVFHAVDLVTENEYAIKAVMKGDGSGHGLKKSAVLQTQLYHYFKSFQNRLFLPAVNLESVLSLSEEDLNRAPHYREIMLQLLCHSHDNVVTIHQILESSLATFIVMDYYQMDLFTSIVDKQHFSCDGILVKKVFLQLCSVINHCHANGVYHCDIKPENILLDKDDNVRLCDFGLATTDPTVQANVCVGSSYYMAPERVSCPTSILHSLDNQDGNLFPTCKGDVWSLGIILINLTCVRNPWLKAHQNQDTTFSYFINDSTVLKKILPISEELFLIVEQVLRLDPWLRIDLTSLMEAVSTCRHFTVSGPLSTVACLTTEQFEYFVGGDESLRVKDMLRRYDDDNGYSSENYDARPGYYSDDEVGYISSVDTTPDISLAPCSAKSASLKIGYLNINLSTMTNYSQESRADQRLSGWLPHYDKLLHDGRQ